MKKLELPLNRRVDRVLRFTVLFSLLFFIGLTVASCRQSVQKRPYGNFRLGKVADLLSKETDLPKLKLLLRRDEKGFYVMSTMCTHDTTYLERREINGQEMYVSTYTDSKYDLNGKLLTGPAVADLPYYKLKFAAGVYGGPVDTLFAEIAVEVPKEWRLAIPTPKVE